MNLAIIMYIIGWVLCFEGIFMCLPIAVSLIYHEEVGYIYFICACLCGVIGTLLTRLKPRIKSLYIKEGFVCVALSWIALSIFGALPFVATGEIPHYIDALFETVSGFTTTGSSILHDVEALSHASLFWRCFTNFVGGMGVLVFIMSIVKLVDGPNIHLMRAESTGPAVGKLVPKIGSTTKILYSIYIGLTFLEFLILVSANMPIFDALTAAVSTAGTGGFGIKNASIGDYSPSQQTIIAVFMILFSINFNLYYFMLIKKGAKWYKNTEARIFLIIIGATTLAITWSLRGYYDTIMTALRHGFFQVATIISSTGFSTTDFNKWSEFAKSILGILMVIGGCAGSTAGGIKISRFIIAFKSVKKELDFYVHPRLVKRLYVDGNPLESSTVRSVNVFFVTYVMILFASFVLISIDGYDFTTSFTSVLASIGNTGPGFGAVGPASNYSIFSSFSKVILMFDMLFGRLEIFPMLVLLNPNTWKGTFRG